jgi:hypothetical protein
MSTRSTLAIIVLAELHGTSLWFSANAVADALHLAWGLTPVDIGHLTSAVQFGFISGTLTVSLSGLADRYSASRIFAVCAVLGAIANAAFALSAGSPPRFSSVSSFAPVGVSDRHEAGGWAGAREGRQRARLAGRHAGDRQRTAHFVRGLDVGTWQGDLHLECWRGRGRDGLRLGDGHTRARAGCNGGVLRVSAPALASARLLRARGACAFWAVAPLLIAH